MQIVPCSITSQELTVHNPSEEGDGIHEGEGNGDDFGDSHQAGTKAGDKSEGFVDNCYKARTKATGDPR